MYDAHDEALWNIPGALDGVINATDICGIQQNYSAQHKCQIEFEAPEDMEPPILVHYELTNFHQNHKNYYLSRDPYQLLGRPSTKQSVLEATNCYPLNKLGNVWLNPCGLIANTFFNDIFTLVKGEDVNGKPLLLQEKGIAWASDLEYKYDHPQGFRKELCEDEYRQPILLPANTSVTTFTVVDNNGTNITTSPVDPETLAETEPLFRLGCNPICCSKPTETTYQDDIAWSCSEPAISPDDGQCWRYHYPDEDTTQYLYETYPNVISPLEGVTNEHFVVWMRVATLPTFRKLYGYFNQTIKAGTKFTIEVEANYVVASFKGSKSIIVSTNNIFGGKNPVLGTSFIGVGFICLVSAIFFTLKHWLKPRKLADKKYLRYKED